jgi:hypothetical protein
MIHVLLWTTRELTEPASPLKKLNSFGFSFSFSFSFLFIFFFQLVQSGQLHNGAKAAVLGSSSSRNSDLPLFVILGQPRASFQPTP